MRHLRAEELIDLAEGHGLEATTKHLGSCAACRRDVVDLRATLALAGEMDVPEPSPLFWEHLSARVREQVAAEPAARIAWFERWVSWRVVIPVTACAMVLAGAFALRGARFAAPATGDGTPAMIGAELAGASDVASLADDPSLSMMADLAGGLEWDEAVEAGFTTRDLVVDRAMAELSAAERQELQRLLQGELSRPGA